MKTKFNLVIFGVVLFFILVYYNYLQAQKGINSTQPSPLSISMVTYPDKVKVGEVGSFVWSVDGSPDLTTPFTTIYWGYEATPGAVTKADSPVALGYPYSQPDFATGSFQLPSKFDVNLVFSRPGKIWFRSYAKVKSDHLWSDEYSIEVSK